MVDISATSSRVRRSAQAIANGFDAYHTEFKQITRRAKERFERRDWHGTQKDGIERLDLYKRDLDRTIEAINTILGHDLRDRSLWKQIKAECSRLIVGRDDCELAETFFNSVTRKIFVTVGVDAEIEYIDSIAEGPCSQAAEPIFKVYASRDVTIELIKDILRSYRFATDYENVQRDAELVTNEINAFLSTFWGACEVEAIEVIGPVFFRNKGAYLVGRIRHGLNIVPLVLPLLHGDGGIKVDAVLLAEAEISLVFSFTHSYFSVEAENPSELVEFLRSVMPQKPIEELYIAIGYNKHGKTERYRSLLRHLKHSDDKFELARGEKGMVMSVFTLPSYDVVFKVIKDQFAYPKTTTRQEVMEKYQLVFKHDRGGRLVDAQEFEYLQFDKARFAADLLEELTRVAGNTVSVTGDYVVIKHLYTERKLTPLNLFIREADPGAVQAAVFDYGRTIKDLAATNIFPGDILLKNFGVTRLGRIVFYDYDELCLLTDCYFRQMPAARDDDEELADEPWFFVNKNDMFPEEFETFLGLQEPLRCFFKAAHGELFQVDFWQQMQKRHRAGEIIDIFPYSEAIRLRNTSEAAETPGTA